jgi:predicted extracellular nuclease
LERQRTKLLQALIALDADIVGMMEMENSTGVEPLADIVDGLNDLLGAGTYAYVDTGTIGTDVIKVGIIYKPGTVSEIGDFAILDASVDARYDDTLNRPALAQTFVEDATGAAFTVVMNHFKSKGCGGATGLEADQGDGQACWNPARVSAAEAMVDWLATYPTGIVDDDVMVMGDLNAYAKEDPIGVFLDAGFTNLVEWFGGAGAYGFVFDGQWGYLDHALASESMFAQVTGTAEYHINADEPSVLDYNTDFKTANHVTSLYAPNEFRTSDHDPVLVGLDLEFDFVVSASPDMLWPPNHSYVGVTVSAATGGDALTVEIVEVTSSEADSGLDGDDLPNDSVITGDDTVDLRAERYSTLGRLYTITVLVSGNGQTALGTTTVYVPHDLGAGGDPF